MTRPVDGSVSTLLVAPTSAMRPRRGPAAVLVGLVVLLLSGLLGTGAVLAGAVPARTDNGSCDPAVRAAPPADISGLDAEQMRNAQTIVDVGRGRGVPPRGWLVAVAVALQESGLRNLDHGDRDSLGLFQQRPSMGWGTTMQVRDPRHAAGRFYDALQQVPDWAGLPVTVAAQRVQRSAFPGAYAKWEGHATRLVAALGQVADLSGCATEASDPAGTVPDAVTAALDWARGQLGKPYRWGGTGPSSFDCSGLVMRAFAAAGITLPRTSRAQFGVGAKVPREQAQPGDLVFWGANPANPATIHHVAVYVGDGRILEAPTAGLQVRIRELRPAERGLLPMVVRPTAKS